MYDVYFLNRGCTLKLGLLGFLVNNLKKKNVCHNDIHKKINESCFLSGTVVLKYNFFGNDYSGEPSRMHQILPFFGNDNWLNTYSH